MYRKVRCTCKVVVLPTVHLLLFLTFSLPSRRGMVKSLLLRGEHDSEDSEDDPIVLINKITNKYAVALYNFLVHIVNEERKKERKASIDGSWIDKQQQHATTTKIEQNKKAKKLPLYYMFLSFGWSELSDCILNILDKTLSCLTPGLSKMTQNKLS